MKFLLLSDIPPCQNYTAGLVLDQLVRFLPPNQIAICAVVNPHLRPEIPKELDAIPRLLLEKPRESSLRILPRSLGEFSAFSFELAQAARVRFKLLPEIAHYATQQKVDALWVVLQGQTMVRLARQLSEKLSLPLFTQIWDPFGWWLRANRLDSLTQRRLRSEFDRVLSHSFSCATASWAMSKNYKQKYGIRNQPVIAGLPKEFVQAPAFQPHLGDELIIGMAGQFYAQSEWSCLINTLDRVNWKIAGRRVRIKVLGGCFQSNAHRPVNFEYLGWQSQEDSIRLLANCDLLYLPYWFSEEFREESINSFPSKLVTYFATGRPVFCHAPAYASPAKYIKRYEAGYLCESLDSIEVLKHLEYAIIDMEYYRKVALNGTVCFQRDFTHESMKEAFFQFLNIQPPT